MTKIKGENLGLKYSNFLLDTLLLDNLPLTYSDTLLANSKLHTNLEFK